MADKYIKQGMAALQEVEATTSSSGASDAGKIIALGTDGKISSTMMPAGIGSDSASIIASEALSAGNLVNLWNDGGTIKARKADASGGIAKQADGFVKDAVAAGSSGVVYFEGTITGMTGLTPGTRYYLDVTPGAVTATIPTTATYIAQYVGKAISATEITFEAGEPIVRA